MEGKDSPNLQISAAPTTMPAAPAANTFLQPYLEPIFGAWLYDESTVISLGPWQIPVWTIVGFIGGGMFSARFLIQWLSTEKNKRLTVPPSFWYCSFWGSLITVVYFIHLDKAPPILMNIFLPVLYLRNLIFLKRAENKTLKG